MRETQSFFLIVAQNNAIRNNYIKIKPNDIQQNSKSGLCGNSNKMIYRILNEYSKLAQKECKTCYEWLE